MSLSDFLVQRILGLKSPTQSQDRSEQQNAITATVPKTSAQLQNFYNVISANSMTDYATALQIMQLQMFCQPSLLNSFLNQITALRLAMNNSNLTKTTSLTETPANVCDVPLRERKRATSRGYDELPQKRPKITRRLHDDSETCSPVSGMFIKEASSLPPADELQAAADLDETAVFVNVSEETRRKIEQITNVIGDCICALCKVRYDDVFRLAQHRCPRIIHEEYRCPECDKVFSCPANLASHRRWHKPRGAEAVPSSSSIFPSSSSFLCPMCSATFDSKKAFKLHSSRCPTVSTSESNHDQNPLLQLLQRSIS